MATKITSCEDAKSLINNNNWDKLQLIQHVSMTCNDNDSSLFTVDLFALAGSMLDFHGDASVNAANQGGVTGFGIDELVNRAGGPAMKEARRALNGISTGHAKFTSSFQHDKVKYVIHAVGPVFRETSIQPTTLQEKFQQLRSAYSNSLQCASQLGCDSVAFCLISAGVFRGNLPLETVVALGMEGILDFYRHHVSRKKGSSKIPTKICLCAFTPEEQDVLAQVFANLPNNTPDFHFFK